MDTSRSFQKRGIVEGFFGPPWSMSHRAALFEFGANRGMNTYLYAPKDDPYHRKHWRKPYPKAEWEALLKLIRLAQRCEIDFVYGFHPGQGLCFTAEEPIRDLFTKADRFYRSGVRTFAVLFDDIPSILEHKVDQKEFDKSLAKAEGIWLKRILEQQPAAWTDVEWWICPSYYTEDPLLVRSFGSFEPNFLETLAVNLPQTIACFWTGPSVVSKNITLSHVRKIARRLKHPLILWDNYPVNDLSMSMEMHLRPLSGRDPQLPQQVYGYLNNPLLQESLSFIPLATCFDYAADPTQYKSESSWSRVITERFGKHAFLHWQRIRNFCEQINKLKNKEQRLNLSPKKRSELEGAHRYILENQKRRWVQEFQPWLDLLEKNLGSKRTRH